MRTWAATLLRRLVLLGVCLGAVLGAGSISVRGIPAPPGSRAAMSRIPFSVSPPVAEAAEMAGVPDAESQVVEKVHVREIVTDPSEILTEAEIRTIVSEYEGRDVTLDELQAVIESLNALYLEKGFITAQALLPPQTIEDGVIYVMLVEGRVGEIAVTGNRSTRSSYVIGRMSLSPGDLVRLDALEEDIFRFNATNDVQLAAQLEAGSSFGTTDIELVLQEPKRLSGSLFYTISERRETGKGQAGVTLINRSVFGWRDSFDLTWTSSEGSQTLSVNYSFPVGRMGSRLNAGYSQSEVRIVGGSFSVVDLGSKSYSGWLGWRRPMVLRPGARFDGLVEFRQNDLETYWDGVKITSSRNQKLSVGVESEHSFERSILQTSHIVTGGRSPDEEDDPGYVKYNTDWTYRLFLGQRYTLKFRVSGQLASRSLLPDAEQFDAVGSGGVRGYAGEKQFTGDKGYVVSAELNAVLKPWLESFIFLDHGVAFPYRGKSRSADQGDDVTTAGVGFAFSLLQRLHGSLVYGIPLGSGDSRPDDSTGSLRFQVQLGF